MARRSRGLGPIADSLVRLAPILAFLVVVWARLSDPTGGGAEGPRVIDLGMVRHPATLASDPLPGEAVRAHHLWGRPTRAEHYRLRFLHGATASDRLARSHREWAEHFAYFQLPDESYHYEGADHCSGTPWSCIYSHVLEDSTPDLDALLDRMAARLAAERWTTTEAARWLLAFVQEIPYRVPSEYPYGVLPTALVASLDWGDCDSKSLLLLALLERVGIDAVMLVSEAYEHAMVGIAVPADGKTYSFRGREYVFAETTASGAPLGYLDPKMRNLFYWDVVPIH